MYSFSTYIEDQSSILEEDSQALQDIVAEQGTSLNALKQLTDSLRRDAASLKAVTLEQQGHIDQLQQQVCLLCNHTTTQQLASSICFHQFTFISHARYMI